MLCVMFGDCLGNVWWVFDNWQLVKLRKHVLSILPIQNDEAHVFEERRRKAFTFSVLGERTVERTHTHNDSKHNDWVSHVSL
jgi:hypothetical protein